MERLTKQTMSSSFSAYGLRPSMMPMGHVLNVDHFHMSEATFPPHPHAGFSAVTWMLPWSKGAFINRDSLGDRTLIKPGELHWTLAGSGMLHEEIPERSGVDCEGLQIFVKLPQELELTTPGAFHLGVDDLGVYTQGTSVARVLVGELEGASSPIPSHARTMLAHVSVSGTMSLQVPSGVEAFVMVLKGEGALDAQPVQAHMASALAHGEHQLNGDALELLVGWGEPMAARPIFQGPFCMFSQDRLTDAARRYRAGEMGALAPSAGRFGR